MFPGEEEKLSGKAPLPPGFFSQSFGWTVRRSDGGGVSLPGVSARYPPEQVPGPGNAKMTGLGRISQGRSFCDFHNPCGPHGLCARKTDPEALQDRFKARFLPRRKERRGVPFSKGTPLPHYKIRSLYSSTISSWLLRVKPAARRAPMAPALSVTRRIIWAVPVFRVVKA